MSFRSLLTELVSTTETADVHSERILNVLRMTDEPVLGTREIAEQIRMSDEGAKGRLETLEEEGRVRSKKVGGWVWDLHPDERREPVPVEIDRLVHAADSVREMFDTTRRLGIYVLFVGFGLLFMGLTSAIMETPLASMSEQMLYWGYGLAAGGGASWALGGGTRLATIAFEQLAYWVCTGKTLHSWRPLGVSPSEHRGQIDPRMIVGLFLLVIVGGPLVQATGTLQKGLLALPGISWAGATVVSLCFLGALVVAVLGLE